MCNPTGLDTDASSDNEPLIKVTLQAGKKVESGPGKISVDKEDDDSSDDEPLSVLAAKLKPKHEANVKNSGVGAKVVESKITATRKRGKCQSVRFALNNCQRENQQKHFDFSQVGRTIQRQLR